MYKLPDPFSARMSSMYLAKFSVSRSRSGKLPIAVTLTGSALSCSSSSTTFFFLDDTLTRFGGEASVGCWSSSSSGILPPIVLRGRPRRFVGVVFSLASSRSSNWTTSLSREPRLLRRVDISLNRRKISGKSNTFA